VSPRQKLLLRRLEGVRPERMVLHARGEGPDEGPAVNGRLQQITYLGSVLVYTVALDWMTLDVRLENLPGVTGPSVGDDVTVSWDIDAESVVED
jgi:ABC-type Fe3+/spermidine/putrescine transport system ATPase subunit